MNTEAVFWAGHARTPRVSISRSIFPLINDRYRIYFGRGDQEEDQIGPLDKNTRAIFGRGYAAEPDILIEQLRKAHRSHGSLGCRFERINIFGGHLAMRPAMLMLMTTLVSYAQRGTEPPKYEVASIKPNADNDLRLAFRFLRNRNAASSEYDHARRPLVRVGLAGLGGDWHRFPMRGSQDLANLVGSISADEVMKLGRDAQILLIEGEVVKCWQVRHYSDRAFVGPVKS